LEAKSPDLFVRPPAGSDRAMPMIVTAGREDSLPKPPDLRQDLGTSPFRSPEIFVTLGVAANRKETRGQAS
jgi:hypothetical protein